MKKAFAIIFASLLVTGFVACGPSAEEVKQDSLLEESLKNERDETSDNLIDSMNRADSIAEAEAMADTAKDSMK